MKKLLAAVLTAALSVSAGVAFGKTTIALVPKGTSPFWKMVEDGAKKAAGETGVDLVVRGPGHEDDIPAQIKMVNYFVDQGVNAIVLAPLNKDQLVEPVSQARKKGIKVVIIDSALSGSDYDSFVATDNVKAGSVGAKTIIGELGANAKGEVIVLRYLKGSASTEDRESGAINTLKSEAPNLTIVDNYWGGTVAGSVKREMDKILQEHPNLIGVLTLTTISTDGVLESLRDHNLAGKIKFVGSGADDLLLDGLDKGEIGALVLQKTRDIGYKGVETAAALLKGDKVDPKVMLDVAVVTKANVNAPENQDLLHP